MPSIFPNPTHEHAPQPEWFLLNFTVLFTALTHNLNIVLTKTYILTHLKFFLFWMRSTPGLYGLYELKYGKLNLFWRCFIRCVHSHGFGRDLRLASTITTTISSIYSILSISYCVAYQSELCVMNHNNTKYFVTYLVMLTIVLLSLSWIIVMQMCNLH